MLRLLRDVMLSSFFLIALGQPALVIPVTLILLGMYTIGYIK
jgi:hypothetical protein